MPASNPQVTTPLAYDLALARSVAYGQLALGLQRPAPERLDRLLCDEARQALAAAAVVIDAASAGGELRSRCAERLPAGSPDELALLHDRLFGHTARGPVCPLETEYGEQAPFRQPHELAHIAGYYQAFGWRAHGRDGERADHVACECEFVSFLARKEAVQIGGGDDRPLETTRDAARGFLREHLGRFGTAFATRLKRADPRGLHGRLAEILAALLRADAQRLRLPLGPATLDLRPPVEDATPMACGSSRAGREPPVRPAAR